MEINVIFSFPLIILIDLILWQLFSILTTESTHVALVAQKVITLWFYSNLLTDTLFGFENS